MNKVITTLGVVSVLSLTACNKTQEGAAFGALVGQAIGGDTKATLIGAGVGMLVGNAGEDNQRQQHHQALNGYTQRRSQTKTVLNPDGTVTTVGTETTDSYRREEGYQGLP